MTDKLRELLKDVQTVYDGKGMVVHPNSCDRLRTEVAKLDNINRLQSEQIEKLKKYGKLLRDICTVMGNDPYMIWRGLEQRVKILWDKSEEADGLKMADNILDRLLEIKPQEWAEIDK